MPGNETSRVIQWWGLICGQRVSIDVGLECPDQSISVAPHCSCKGRGGRCRASARGESHNQLCMSSHALPECVVGQSHALDGGDPGENIESFTQRIDVARTGFPDHYRFFQVSDSPGNGHGCLVRTLSP